jgi:hypothetical protein
VNLISWCPSKRYENLIASVGDDSVAKIWRFVSV